MTSFSIPSLVTGFPNLSSYGEAKAAMTAGLQARTPTAFGPLGTAPRVEELPHRTAPPRKDNTGSRLAREHSLRPEMCVSPSCPRLASSLMTITTSW